MDPKKLNTRAGSTARPRDLAEGIRGGRCARPGCARQFVQKRRGRPRRWCSDRCRMAAVRAQ